MLISEGIRRKHFKLKDDRLLVENRAIQIEDLKRLEDEDSNMILFAAVSIPFSMVIVSLLSYELIRLLETPWNYHWSDKYGLPFAIALIVAFDFYLLRKVFFLKSQSSVWRVNEMKTIYIGKSDPPHIERWIIEKAKQIEALPGPRTRSCPHCKKKTEPVMPGHYTCVRCKTLFEVTANWQTKIKKRTKIYSFFIWLALILLGATLAAQELFHLRLEEGFFKTVIPLFLLTIFGSNAAEAMHHGRHSGMRGPDIFSEQHPKTFMAMVLIDLLAVWLAMGYLIGAFDHFFQ